MNDVCLLLPEEIRFSVRLNEFSHKQCSRWAGGNCSTLRTHWKQNPAVRL